jgi:beta-lactam-binding protein with PASTA domain
MNARPRTLALTLGLLAALAVGGCATATPAPVANPAPLVTAPAFLTVPNVVGMSDAQARQTLRTAGFTNVVLGPSTGAQAGVAAGTVTTQLPGIGSKASAGDPVTLGEAAAPPVVAAPVTQAPAAAPAPVQAPAPRTQAAPAPRAQAPATQAPRPLVAQAPAAAPAPASSGASYKNCTEARNAGVTPIRRGEPGYSSKLDRDGDGIACE